MRRWPVVFKDQLYPIIMLLILLLVVLAAMTNRFAGLRRQITLLRRNAAEVQQELRHYHADLLGQVWCTTVFTRDEERLSYGHYPGMSPQEVMVFHNGPIWMLRDPNREHRTSCFRSWRAAAAAESLPLNLAEDASEEAYQNAVLAFYLDKADPTPVVAGSSASADRSDDPAMETNAGATAEAPIDPEAIWCFSEIKTIENLVVTVPHPSGGRAAIETVLDALADRSAFEEYTIRSSICFTSWPEAADYITSGEVWLPDDATEQQYHAAIRKWQDAKR